ncbi:hypothetical protein [Bacteroides ovatus]|uniref:hypothetical protein n=2 Tax=Bacteroides TaxID=816 RepID=UPI0020A7A56E|nr:hypothetical protein [Bacteroides ovatus]
MFLFVSSFDYNDKNIVKEIVDNARRIDRLTGTEICFFYFVEERNEIETTNTATDDLMYWIMNVKDRGPMYGAGINVTIETADNICKSVIWQGSFTKCSFDYFVPNDVDVDELSCESDILK